MDSNPQFPDDENGQVLLQMYEGGDDLTQSRLVDFCFVFAEREHALAFIRDVDDLDNEICLSWYQTRSSWQVIVKRDMVPSHTHITALESDLTLKAKRAGGRADGWGCMLAPPTSH